MNWIEQRPKEGDTVKVFLSLPDEILIGVALRYHDGKVIIDNGLPLGERSGSDFYRVPECPQAGVVRQSALAAAVRHPRSGSPL